MASPIRLVAAVLALVATAAVAALVATPAAAQGRIVARHGDWQTRCERPVGAPSEQCALVQNVEAQDRANVSLTVIFLQTADRQARILRVLAPLGVLLPSGLGLSIDGNEVGLAGFVRCLPEGCIAEVELDNGLIERFEAGTTATFVIFQTPEEGIGIPISLAGFADGFAALDNPPPPPEEVTAETAEPRAPVETPTSIVAADDTSADRFLNAFESDDRTEIDRLLEDPLFPYVAGAAGVVLLLILGTIVFVVRAGSRRRRRREARDVRDVAFEEPSDGRETEDGPAEEPEPEPTPRTRTPPRLAKPTGEVQLPAVAPRQRPQPPAKQPASPSAPRPPRP
jgi:invasion protein IalB